MRAPGLDRFERGSRRDPRRIDPHQPDGATTWLLPRLVGMRVAQEMAAMIRRITSDGPGSLGLITRALYDA